MGKMADNRPVPIIGRLSVHLYSVPPQVTEDLALNTGSDAR